MNDNQPHRFYGGIGRHARSLYAHVLDHQGKTVFEQDLPADPGAFRSAAVPSPGGEGAGPRKAVWCHSGDRVRRRCREPSRCRVLSASRSERVE